MHLGCAPSSLHINIALSFHPPPSPARSCREKPGPGRAPTRAPPGRPCPTPSTFPEALPGPSALNIRRRNKRRPCKFLNRAICSARFTRDEASAKFCPHLGGAEILMMPGRAMSLVLRDPFRAWGGTRQAVKMSQLWDHPLAWAPSQVPPCLGTIPRSWGPFQAPPWLGPSWELRDHPRLLEIFPGFFLPWRPSKDLGEGSSWFVGIIWGAFHLGDSFGVSESILGWFQGSSQALGHHPGVLRIILTSGDHLGCFSPWG